MILQDTILYLQGRTSLTSLVGNHIYAGQAPGGIQMPWLVVTVAAGPREQLTQNTMEISVIVRITVDVGPAQYILGASIAEAALRSLENFRGLFITANDAHITCGEVRNWAGTGGAHRYQFDAVITYTEAYQAPS